MYLDSHATIAGQPALTVRAFFRTHRDGGWNYSVVCQHFGVTADIAESINSQLIQLGYAVPDPQTPGNHRATREASRLALGTFARPLHRNAADKKLRELLDRIETVNRSDEFIYKVTKAAVLGSYLSDKQRISDIDIALALDRKEPDSEKYESIRAKKLEDAHASGRTFKGMFDELYWPEKEVLLFLKSKSRSFSFHEFDELKTLGRFQIIFGENLPHLRSEEGASNTPLRGLVS